MATNGTPMRPENLDLDSPRSHNSTPMPEFVKCQGVDPQSLMLAELFMDKMGDLARLMRFRNQLSKLYLSTKETWMNPEILDDMTQQRHFSNVLYALSSGEGMSVLRVVDGGRVLVWKPRHRDDYHQHEPC